MKILMEDELIYELSEIQKRVIKNDIPEEIFDEDMARRCKYWAEVAQDKHCHMNRTHFEHKAKEQGLKTIPTDNLKLGVMVCCDGDKATYGTLKCKCGPIEFEISEDHQKMCKYCCQGKEDKIDVIMKDRMLWIINEKYKRCLERMKLEWLPKLEEAGIKDVPVDNDKFAELVFNHPGYKSRSQRETDMTPKPV